MPLCGPGTLREPLDARVCRSGESNVIATWLQWGSGNGSAPAADASNGEKHCGRTAARQSCG